MRSLLPCVALAAVAALNAATAFFASAATEPEGTYYLAFAGGVVEMPRCPPLRTRATLQMPPLRVFGVVAPRRVRALVLEAVRRDFAKWPRVSIREGELPEHLGDNVVVVGGRAPSGSGLLGLADAVDAGDRLSNERAVVFAESVVELLHAPPSTAAAEEQAAQAIANTVSHEIGHMLGFAHAKRRGGSDIMFPGVGEEAGLEQAFLIHHQSYAAPWWRRMVHEGRTPACTGW